MKGETLISLLILSFVFFAQGFEGSDSDYSTNVTVYWKGGVGRCNNCTDGTLFNGSYACNYDSLGNWNEGQATFTDPLPSSFYMVTQVFLNLAGRFNCDFQLEGTEMLSQLNSAIISVTTPSQDPQGCFCPRCVTTIPIASPYSGNGWSDYKYGGTNTLQIKAVNAVNKICLSYADLTLKYTLANPTLVAVFPTSGPVTGNTTASIFSSGSFSPDIPIQCLFGDPDTAIPVNATFSNSNVIRCTTPPQIKASKVTLYLRLVPVGRIFNSQYVFNFYEQPVLKSLVPSKGMCNGNNVVTVVGSGFFPMASSVCKWNGQSVTYTYLNKTHVQCPTLQMVGSTTLTVSPNAYDDTNSLPFNCESTPEPTPPPHKGFVFPGWAWVLIVFGGVTMAILALLFASRGCNRNPDDLDASQPLLHSSTSEIFFRQIDFSDIKGLHKIGKGTFGEVFKGTWNGTEVAVKFLNASNMNDEFLADFNKEVQIMRALRHPNILQFLGACSTLPNVCIVMEYMPLGSLYKILHDDTIANIELNLLRRMMLDAARGMNYLHKSDPMIIHRDLKSHNLLVDENWKVKVCDFGLSKILETQGEFTSMTACGTPSWSAPEILRNEYYSEKADVYSFGVVLWECITREDPYYGMAPYQVVLAVGTKELRPTIPNDCPPKWAQLIKDCWQEDQEKRPSFDDIMLRLESM